MWSVATIPEHLPESAELPVLAPCRERQLTGQVSHGASQVHPASPEHVQHVHGFPCPASAFAHMTDAAPHRRGRKRQSARKIELRMSRYVNTRDMLHLPK